MTHAELVTLAERWLRTKRHAVVLSDVHSFATSEQPDVIGWCNTGFSTVIECKASRADFLRDAKKDFRRDASLGMGYARYYLAPAGTFVEADLPTGWGWIEPTSRSLRVVKKSAPFTNRSEAEERRLLINAIRRATEGWGRRIFGEIAPPLVDGDPHPTASKIIRDLRAETRRLSEELRALRGRA